MTWQRHEADFGASVVIEGSAVVQDRIVVIGNRLTPSGYGHVPAIWWEDGDLVWRLADLPPIHGQDPWLSAIARGGPGLVAVGTYFDDDYSHLHALVLLSTDGKTWQAVDAPALDDGLWNAQSHGPGATLVAAEGGLILIGRDGEAGGTNIAFVSVDGRDWRHAADPAAGELAYGYVINGSRPLTGFGSRLEPCCAGDVTGGDPVVPVGPVRVWRALGLDDWTLVSELPGSASSSVVAGAVGPRGWVAVGGGAWQSTDGAEWRAASTAPDGIVCTIFGVEAGFVGIGTDNWYCGLLDHDDVGPASNLTWTSSDGTNWVLADTLERGALIKTLRRRGQTLIGIGTVDGTRWPGRPSTGAVWTARLP